MIENVLLFLREKKSVKEKNANVNLSEWNGASVDDVLILFRF